MKLKCLYQESPRRQWTYCIIHVYFTVDTCVVLDTVYLIFDKILTLHIIQGGAKRRHEFKTAILKVLLLKVRLCILISTFSLQNRLFNLGYLDLFWGSKKSR